MTGFLNLARFYLVNMKTAVAAEFQYRVAQYFYMIGMVAEPVIYLVVWSTIAKAQGGEVGGYTAGAFAAYYIVWTLVRNMNIVFTPYGWEWRIRQGMLAGMLMRPLHPLHYDISWFAGWKFVVIILWLPIAVVLTLAFHPVFAPTPLGIVVFLFAIWGAYLVRTMLLWLLGMLSFWTTRVSAIFELYFVLELMLSGRLVPLSLMPDWVQALAAYLPFKWAFGFPIETLVGHMTNAQLLSGLGMQALWIALGALAVNVVWRQGVRQFTSVGN
jgi:ABC-2 type transport system permease protein